MKLTLNSRAVDQTHELVFICQEPTQIIRIFITLKKLGHPYENPHLMKFGPGIQPNARRRVECRQAVALWQTNGAADGSGESCLAGCRRLARKKQLVLRY